MGNHLVFGIVKDFWEITDNRNPPERNPGQAHFDKKKTRLHKGRFPRNCLRLIVIIFLQERK